MASDETFSVLLNGEAREVPAGWTLSRLLEDLGKSPTLVAVERNGEIVARGLYESTELARDDRLEVVQFVQGG